MPFCCVPGCQSGSEIEIRQRAGKKGPSFFRVTKSNILDWNKVVPRQDRQLTLRDSICELHFYASNIERFHEDLQIGNVVIKGEPKPPKLKPGALPCLWNIEGASYLDKPDPLKKRKAPTERQLPSKRKGYPEDNLDNQDEDPIPPPHAIPPTPPSFIDPQTVSMPSKGWGVHVHEKVHFYSKVDEECKTTHVLVVKADHSISLVMGRCKVSIPALRSNAETASALTKAMEEADKYTPCEGNGFQSFSRKCLGGVLTGIRCTHCMQYRKSEQRKITRRTAEKRKEEAKTRSRKLCNLRKEKYHLKEKVKSLRQRLQETYKECQKKKRDHVHKAIQDLPEIQQRMVFLCLDAAKKQGPQGNRYATEWIYEAILMRIKSPRLYEHIRERNILPLPSRITLNRYMRKLHPVYGFQSTLFEVMKLKTSSWQESERHGVLLLDEMKLIPGVGFDRHSLKAYGFVELPDGVADDQQEELGDHALQVLFQPFQGGWIQSLGCFLTHSNAKGDVLAKLILEGTTLAENAGLMVDGIVVDGASWNRVMWEKFGIGEETSSCIHPFHESRRLWFLSDWCHLLKCMRNTMCPIIPTNKKQVPDTTLHTTERAGTVKKRRQETDEELEKRRQAALQKEIETPDGVVKRMHWTALYNEEKKMAQKYGVGALTYVPHFTKHHVLPSGFERMNVKLAQQFFSNKVRAGMAHYRAKGVKELEDSEPTELFITKVNSLADAMNAHNPAGAFRIGSSSEKAIEDFLEYFSKCLAVAKERGKNCFISMSTDLGILVTLRATKELSYYLIEQVKYDYVMTVRFNQDAIEQFFASIRSACGPNTHPDPKLYAQLHRLLAVYSLIKPPKGSNVSGVDNVRALVSAEDHIAAAESERKHMIEDILDEVIDYGEAFEPLPLLHMSEHSYSIAAPVMEENLLKFMAGFTAHRQKKVAKGCENCLMTFTQFREEADSGHDFVKRKELFNGYSYASNELSSLIKAVETAVQESLHKHGIHRDMFITALKYLKLTPGDMVGCAEHMKSVTKTLVTFYLTMRMFFATDRHNDAVEGIKKAKLLKKTYNKQAKLQ